MNRQKNDVYPEITKLIALNNYLSFSSPLLFIITNNKLNFLKENLKYPSRIIYDNDITTIKNTFTVSP